MVRDAHFGLLTMRPINSSACSCDSATKSHAPPLSHPQGERYHRHVSALSTIAVARPSLTVRLGGSPAQIAILVGVALFLIAFMIVPILRVIVVAFTAPEGGFTLIHFSDFLDSERLLRDSFLGFDLMSPP